MQHDDDIGVSASGAALEPPRVASRAIARTLQVLRPGRIPYGDALVLQQQLVEQRRAQQITDQLVLLEHPHVITLGTSAHEENVLLNEDERRLLGIEMFETGRGGDVTYHGPGQLVGYPIIDLKPDR